MSLDPLVPTLRAFATTHGYELVDVVRRGTARAPLYQIRLDRADSAPGRGVTVEDCVMMTRALREAWPELGPPDTEPTFEVSSPGVERPVRFLEHWRRYVGREVRVKSRALGGKVVATIADVPDDGHVTLAPKKGEPRTLAFDEIQEAQLVYDWSAPRHTQE